MSKREKFLLRVQKGALVPDDVATARRLREKGYKVGDVLSAELSKPRNPKFHRMAHAFGELVAENIEGFEGMGQHQVLKRLQLEAGVGCDEILLNVPKVGMVPYRVPQSLSFASMDEAQFKRVYRGLTQHVSDTYWPDLSPEEIEAMAELMPEVE